MLESKVLNSSRGHQSAMLRQLAGHDSPYSASGFAISLDCAGPKLCAVARLGLRPAADTVVIPVVLVFRNSAWRWYLPGSPPGELKSSARCQPWLRPALYHDTGTSCLHICGCSWRCLCLQVVWFDVSSAGQAWQVQRAADPQFLNNVATVPGTPGLLCSGCTAQFTLSDPQSAGRRCHELLSCRQHSSGNMS